MHIHDIIASVAAICTTIAFLPQVMLVLKTRNTDAISLTMYTVFIVGVALWFVYGFLTLQWPIIISNIITFVLAFIIWLSKFLSSKGKSKRVS